MNDEERNRAFEAFLAARKHPAEPDEGFVERVMSSARAWEAERVTAPRAREPKRRGPMEWVREHFAIFSNGGRGLAFAFIALIAVTISIVRIREGGRDETRIKGGGFRLEFLVKRGETIARADQGAAFLPGDRLQAVYSSPVRGYLRLFSLSAAGEIECLSCNAASEEVAPGQGRSLGYALELDTNGTEEMIIGVFTADPVPEDVSMRALEEAWGRAGRTLEKTGTELRRLLPSGASVSEFKIRKGNGKGKGNSI